MNGAGLPVVSGLFGLESSSLEVRRPLDAGWEFCTCAPDAFDHPDELAGHGLEWLPVSVPGTVAGALRALGRFDQAPAPGLDERDYWFRARWVVDPADDGPLRLHFEGLATLAEVFLDGRRVLTADNMFRHYVLELPAGNTVSEAVQLVIRFRSLAAALEAPRPRARWRTRLASHRNLRYVRTALLGHMPGVCPPVPAIGPWRPIARVAQRVLRPVQLRVRPSVRGSQGIVETLLELACAPGADWGDASLQIVVGDRRAPLVPEAAATAGPDARRFAGSVVLDDVERWWPHTHGRPQLYTAHIEGVVAGQALRLELAPIGFRSIELRDPEGDAELLVNDVPIFCRGACWTPIDLVSLGASPDDLRRALEDARDAGMNMLRITGNMVYESTAFYALCDALGILVWQDFMFASLDYPTQDPDFIANVEREVDDTLDRIAYRPSLAVLCAGSELAQQPAMLGLPRELWHDDWFTIRLPELCRAHRPDVPYCAGSPIGGVLPFHADRGIAHWFGVGAYRRGLDDAWLAEPRFASECLAFAIPPEGAAGQDQDAPVPRDAGADWDFMDVTDHYVRLLYGRDPAELPVALRAHVRSAAVGEAMARVQSVWRRPGARCRGALVWLLRDLGPGAGCGLVAADGSVKAPLHYLRRVWSPVSVHVLDRGLNGLRIVVTNDTPHGLRGELRLHLLRLDGTTTGSAAAPIECPARSGTEHALEALLGSFVDSSHAYRFGPPAFDIVRATFEAVDAANAPQRHEVVYLRDGLGLLPQSTLGLRAVVTPHDAQSARVWISTERFAQAVRIDAAGVRVSDAYFHLCPGDARAVTVAASAEWIAANCSVRALNADAPAPITFDLDRDEPRRG
ncbi:MAG: hypothetical protein KF911_11845 [Pseudomonadales bacterium]|nr:hypothetical protein [Pseudomonadales bacterium]